MQVCHTAELKGVLCLRRRVRIIEDDEDSAYAGDSEEDGSVLFAVSGHDADAIADADTEGHQAPGELRALVVELIVSPPRTGPRRDNALLRAMVLALQVEQLAEGQVDQGGIDRAL